MNDPVLLRLAENHFWLSLADNDVLLWAQGVAVNSEMDVSISEPDVSPLQLQGPNSGKIMRALFGESIADLRYYWLREIELDGIPLVVSRTGWSSELGYELYLRDGSRGDDLWEKIMAAGAEHDLAAGHTSSIRRIEGGMLSYHADMDINTNPYELGLDRLVDLDTDNVFIGRAALQKIHDSGVLKKQVGIEISGDPLSAPNTTFWPLLKDEKVVGQVTSAVYSPRLKRNIALAMVSIEYAEIGTQLVVHHSAGSSRHSSSRHGSSRYGSASVSSNSAAPVSATVVEKPFYDPRKKIVSNS